jgi:asparagine synthase (glutamine-hydrolysing)
MAAFFAMSWTQRDPEANQQAQHILQRIGTRHDRDLDRFDRDGFALVHLDPARRDAAILPLQGNHKSTSGAIFGTLFRRQQTSSPGPVAALAPIEADGIVRSEGETLISDFWGRYVAFLPSGSGLFVMTDPSSAIPCFYCRQGKLRLAFSNLELCEFIDIRDFSPNLRFVRTLLAYDKVQTGETGLENVFELGLGQCVRMGQTADELSQVWDPRTIASKVWRPPSEEAKGALGKTIDHCVACWAHGRSDIRLQLSGGVDSALVAAALARTARPDAVEAVHIRLQSGDPSEAHHARSVANRLGLRYSEVAFSGDEPLPPADGHPRSVRPYREFTGGTQLARSLALHGRESATLFTGQGGDHLFQEVRTSDGFADYLKTVGPGRNTGRELLNAARLSGRSVWSVLAATLPLLVSRTGPPATAPRITRLNRAACEGLDLDALLPAWARQGGGLPPAKASQVNSLLHMIHVRSGLPLPDRIAMVHPLVSQPLIELCLTLPIYLLCLNGQPRGLLRAAMRDRLPDAVRLRRSKGDASRFYMQQLTSNRTRLAETLADGHLVRLGLLDKADIDAFLKDESYTLHQYGRTLFACYAIESWLRAWSRP